MILQITKHVLEVLNHYPDSLNLEKDDEKKLHVNLQLFQTVSMSNINWSLSGVFSGVLTILNDISETSRSTGIERSSYKRNEAIDSKVEKEQWQNRERD